MARRDSDLRPLVTNHDRQLGVEIHQVCRDMFGPELAAHPRFEETFNRLVQGMRGAGLVVELTRSAARSSCASGTASRARPWTCRSERVDPDEGTPTSQRRSSMLSRSVSQSRWCSALHRISTVSRL